MIRVRFKEAIRSDLGFRWQYDPSHTGNDIIRVTARGSNAVVTKA
jgi:hypothetical protein